MPRKKIEKERKAAMTGAERMRRYRAKMTPEKKAQTTGKGHAEIAAQKSQIEAMQN